MAGVVPMIGIQFGVYEVSIVLCSYIWGMSRFVKEFYSHTTMLLKKATKKIMLARETKESISPNQRLSKADRKKLDEEKENERSRRERLMEEMAMEVAADDDQPYPAPYRKRDWWGMAVQQLKKEKQPCGVSKIAR